MSNATDDLTAERAAALHEAAEHLLAHPGLPAPYITSSGNGRGQVSYQLSITAKDEQRDAARRIIRTIGGEWKKWSGSQDFYFQATSGRLDLLVQADREQVCVRRVVGTTQVTLPAVEARPERVETHDVVEWDCSPILADEPVPYVVAGGES